MIRRSKVIKKKVIKQSKKKNNKTNQKSKKNLKRKTTKKWPGNIKRHFLRRYQSFSYPSVNFQRIVKIKWITIIRTSQKNRKKEWKTKIRIGKRSPPCPTRPAADAPPTRPGVPHLYRAGDTRRGQGVRQPDEQVGLPEGKPDRCNPDRCPADPTEGDISRWRFQG